MNPTTLNTASVSSQVDVAGIVAKTHDTSTYLEASNKATSSTYMQPSVLYASEAYFLIHAQPYRPIHENVTTLGTPAACFLVHVLSHHK